MVNPILMKAAAELGKKALCAAGLAALKILSDKLQEKQEEMKTKAEPAEVESIITADPNDIPKEEK
jgi:hypothetical protein